MSAQAVLLGLAAVVACTAGGFWAGHDYRDAKAGRERAAELADTSKALERAMEAREVARAAAAAVGANTQAALQRALDARRDPIPCPPTGDVRDAVLPGLGDRLRDIQAAGGAGPAGVDPLPAASDPGR